MGRLRRESLWTLSRAALLVGAGALAGCSSAMPDFTQFKVPTGRSFLPENMDTYVPPTSARANAPVTANDLVDGQGACAGAAPPPAAAVGAAPPPAAAPPAEKAETALAGPVPPPAANAAPAVLGSVGLDMTECEVVRTIGPPQSISIGTGERGERQVTMIYMGNERAGTYVFRNGRLSSLERGPEPPPPPAEKPKKKKPVAKKKQKPPPKPQQPAT